MAQEGSRTPWTRWWDEIAPPVADLLVAIATAAVAVGLMVVGDEVGRREPDLLGYAALVFVSAPLAVRRRWPGWMVAATAVLALGYLAVAYPGGPVTVPVLVALYSAAAWQQRTPALVALGFFAGLGSLHRLVVQREPFVTVAFQAVLFVFAWLLGELVASRRLLRAEAEARLRRVAEERERDAARRMQQERLRIARELHDVLAHTVSTMMVQSGAAADLVDDRPHEARRALQSLRSAGRDAMSELRATVNLLRSGEDSTEPGAPAPGLADLDMLVERVRRDGLAVERSTVGVPRPLPPAVELTAYRIVQEALTNVVRHADARSALVSLRFDADALVVEISDDGRAPGGHLHPGLGVRGMRERVAALGGDFAIGVRGGGGVSVRATLPVREEAP